jgi:hypothetical protein
MGWGSFAQVTTPAYAIGKFLDSYLAYRRKGLGWLQASHKTQRSAYPSAPARWYGEGMAFARAFAGSGGGDPGALGTSDAGGDTGTQPYEFSRGDGNRREDTWTASGRLADEVQWRRFVRAGTFWYVSDEWLLKQRVIARLNEFSPGVVALTFEAETRRLASEATLQMSTRRYAILPGDAIEVYDEGAGSGLWLVANVGRNLTSQVAEIKLVRKRVKLPEPAPSQSGVTAMGTGQETSGTSGDTARASILAQRAYAAAEQYSAWRARYSQPLRNQLQEGPFRYGDCSSGVSWVLWKAGIPLPGRVRSGWAPSTHAYPGWGARGMGKFFTVMVNFQVHIWIRWNGMGRAWRFDTGGGLAPHQQSTPRGTGGFVALHWPGC